MGSDIKYIYQLPDWPSFRWDKLLLSDALASLRHKQGRLLGRMEALGFDLQAEATLNTLTREIINSSAIEGEALSSDEVRSSIAQRLGLDAAGLPGASNKVDGIVEMMLDATQNHNSELTEERLFNWHAALFPTGRSGLKRITVGAWRTDMHGPMQVVSGPIGKERIHFEAPPAETLNIEMARFLEWFNQNSDIDPVIKAAISHFWFVTIHPFDDGNGRIGRAISEMVLSRADGTGNRFYTMSSGIAAERKEYYSQLEKGQKGNLDITQWIEWFLGCLNRVIDNAGSSIDSVLNKARIWQKINVKPVNKRQQIVVNKMLGNWEGNLNTSKYATIAKCSTDTALRDIQELMERGVLLKNKARGRSTSYRLNPDF